MVVEQINTTLRMQEIANDVIEMLRKIKNGEKTIEDLLIFAIEIVKHQVYDIKRWKTVGYDILLTYGGPSVKLKTIEACIEIRWEKYELIVDIPYELWPVLDEIEKYLNSL